MSGKVVVFQSHADAAPDWVHRCTATVRRWASSSGFEYYFENDSFLGRVPSYLVDALAHHRPLLTDYSRVDLARELIASGADLAIWVDADCLVIAPDDLSIRPATSYCFTREVWIEPRTEDGGLEVATKVNNSVCAFRGPQSLSFLDQYRRRLVNIAQRERPLTKLSFSTNLLTDIHHRAPFELLYQVGILSPAMAQAIVNDSVDILDLYLRFVGGPIAAINLCGSLLNHSERYAHKFGDPGMNAIVDVLVDRSCSVFQHFTDYGAFIGHSSRDRDRSQRR